MLGNSNLIHYVYYGDFSKISLYFIILLEYFYLIDALKIALVINIQEIYTKYFIEITYTNKNVY